MGKTYLGVLRASAVSSLPDGEQVASSLGDQRENSTRPQPVAHGMTGS